MLIAEIHADGFRNLNGVLKCEPGINILCGENAQGKTSWLEAIYVLGSTKSFRTSALKEAIRIGGQRKALLRGTVHREGLVKEMQLHIDDSGKSFYVNGKREPVLRYIGNLDVVVFSMEELSIVRGEPAERRRFLDRGIVGLHPSYLKIIADYNRILKQKNALLKDAAQAENRRRYIDLIETWNEQLVESAAVIHRMRTEYTAQLRQALKSRLFSEREIDIKYRSALESHGLSPAASETEYARLMTERLQVRLENELAAGYALIGPHRDELEVMIEGLEVSRFASSGEQRSALITLDLAQISVYNSVFEEFPVFLIDDIDAELDIRRISLLLEHVEGKMQVFVSTSKRTIAEMYRNRAKCWTISQGKVFDPPEYRESSLRPDLFERPLVEASEVSVSDFRSELEEKHKAPF